MSLSRAVRYGKTSHRIIEQATGHATAPLTAKDIAFKTEWANAAREVHENADQVALGYAYREQTITPWTGANFGTWVALAGPSVPNMGFADATNVGRRGRQINVKRIDANWSLTGTMAAPSAIPAEMVVRVVWYVMLKGGGAPNITNFFDGVSSAGSTNALNNTSVAYDPAGARQFKIISDQVHVFPFKGLASQYVTWTDGIDVNYTTTWPSADTAGAQGTADTNGLYCYICAIRSYDAQAAQAASADQLTGSVVMRILYLDGP